VNLCKKIRFLLTIGMVAMVAAGGSAMAAQASSVSGSASAMQQASMPKQAENADKKGSSRAVSREHCVEKKSDGLFITEIWCNDDTGDTFERHVLDLQASATAERHQEQADEKLQSHNDSPKESVEKERVQATKQASVDAASGIQVKKEEGGLVSSLVLTAPSSTASSMPSPLAMNALLPTQAVAMNSQLPPSASVVSSTSSSAISPSAMAPTPSDTNHTSDEKISRERSWYLLPFVTLNAADGSTKMVSGDLFNVTSLVTTLQKNYREKHASWLDTTKEFEANIAAFNKAAYLQTEWQLVFFVHILELCNTVPVCDSNVLAAKVRDYLLTTFAVPTIRDKQQRLQGLQQLIQAVHFWQINALAPCLQKITDTLSSELNTFDGKLPDAKGAEGKECKRSDDGSTNASVRSHVSPFVLAKLSTMPFNASLAASARVSSCARSATADTKNGSIAGRLIIQYPGLLQHDDFAAYGRVNLCGYYAAFFIDTLLRASEAKDYNDLDDRKAFDRFFTAKKFQSNIDDRAIQALLPAAVVKNVASIAQGDLTNGSIDPIVVPAFLGHLDCKKPIGLIINTGEHHWVAGMITNNDGVLVLRVVDSLGKDCTKLHIVTAIYDYFMQKMQRSVVTAIPQSLATEAKEAIELCRKQLQVEQARLKIAQEGAETLVADEELAASRGCCCSLLHYSLLVGKFILWDIPKTILWIAYHTILFGLKALGLGAQGVCFGANGIRIFVEAIVAAMRWVVNHAPTMAELKMIAKWSTIGVPTLVYALAVIRGAIAAYPTVPLGLIIKYTAAWMGIPLAVVAGLVAVCRRYA